MRPDPLIALHQALRFGPGYCPPELFEGSVPAIVRGLRVHANNIAHARHIALEETYPRLLRKMGEHAFRHAAEAFLDLPGVLGRSLDALGAGFDEYLAEAGERDLARTEWAWLEAFHAFDAAALVLAELAAMKPESLVDAALGLHPATRIAVLEEPAAFAWDEPIGGAGEDLLLTRPDAELKLRWIGPAEAKLVRLLASSPVPMTVLDEEPAALISLIDAGALVLEIE
jgi:hypothetical protein